MFYKEFSKTDYEILRIMVSEGEYNSTKIAKMIGVSDKTVRNRIKIMKDLKIFKKVIVVNPEAFGYNLKVDYFLEVHKENLVQVSDWLLNAHKHNIAYLGRHWGNDNISVQSLFKSSKDVVAFNEELSLNPLITNFDMTVVPIVFKDTYDWRPHQDSFKITEKGLKELEKRREEEAKEKTTE